LTETIQAENTNLTLFSLEKYESGKLMQFEKPDFKIQILESKIQDLLTRKSRFWNLDLKSRLQIKIQILDLYPDSGIYVSDPSVLKFSIMFFVAIPVIFRQP
jgi:hypothetical protein